MEEAPSAPQEAGRLKLYHPASASQESWDYTVHHHAHLQEFETGEILYPRGYFAVSGDTVLSYLVCVCKLQYRNKKEERKREGRKEGKKEGRKEGRERKKKGERERKRK
jgi:hypothetical protein